MAVPTDASSPADPRRDLLISVALNAGVPVLIYEVAKRSFSATELAALTAAALFPLAWSVVDAVRAHALDPVALLSITGIGISMAAVLLGGSPRLLLIRESLFTGAFGVACFASLPTPRPLLFYFARHFAAGRDPRQIAEFNRGWERAGFRHTIRIMTLVWGVALVLECAIRVTMVFTLPPAAVLVISPIVLGVVLATTVTWTITYGRRARARAAALTSGGPA